MCSFFLRVSDCDAKPAGVVGALGVGVIGQEKAGLGDDQTVFFNAAFVKVLLSKLFVITLLTPQHRW